MSVEHYLAHTPEERREMLRAVGFSTVEELMAAAIPPELWTQRPLELPEALSEEEARRLSEYMASLNARLRVFAGGGAYDHFSPAAVDHIAQRAEFYTAYTPYQPEVSQGTLQAMFEYQSMVAELMGMEVANASMYDGASALAEAVLMAFRVKRRYTAVVPKALNPLHRAVLATYLHGLEPRFVSPEEAKGQGCEIVEVPYNEKTGQVDLGALEVAMQKSQPAAVVVQHPNYFGILEPVREVSRLAKAKGALLIASVDPVSLGILEPPGAYDADIAVAEGQGLGLPLGFGGPYLGIFTAKKAYIRQMPGRIAAQTVDAEGKRGFVTTLQTREQHIRREKATSNICTNQQLCALMVAVHLSLLGPKGIREVAVQSLQKAHYLAGKISHLSNYGLLFEGPFFKEFAVYHKEKRSSQVIDELGERGYLVGPSLPKEVCEWGFLVAVTERRTKEELDGLVSAMEQV